MTAMQTSPAGRFPEALVEELRHARRVAALTGAGFSAESGVPTFREAQTGLWAQYKAEELATPQAYQRNPKLVWEFYNARRGMMGSKKPNPGHFAISRLEERAKNFTLITQNIDNLHRDAGSENILELHGNVWRVRCLKCGDIFEERYLRRPPREATR